MQVDPEFTAEDLIDLMPIVQGDWHLRYAMIRKEGQVCPVCALVNEVKGVSNWTAASGYAMVHLVGRNLTPAEQNEVMRITRAADDNRSPLRGALLASLGLEEWLDAGNRPVSLHPLGEKS